MLENHSTKNATLEKQPHYKGQLTWFITPLLITSSKIKC